MQQHPLMLQLGGVNAEADVPGYKPEFDVPITTSAIPLFKLPHSRLLELLEFIEPKLDCVLMAEVDAPQLSIVLWQITNWRPNMNITDFKVKKYIELYKRARNSLERRKLTKDPAPYINAVVTCPDDERNQVIMSLAVDAGFEAEWLGIQKKKTPQKAKIQEAQSSLLSLMERKKKRRAADDEMKAVRI